MSCGCTNNTPGWTKIQPEGLCFKALRPTTLGPLVHHGQVVPPGSWIVRMPQLNATIVVSDANYQRYFVPLLGDSHAS